MQGPRSKEQIQCYHLNTLAFERQILFITVLPIASKTYLFLLDGHYLPIYLLSTEKNFFSAIYQPTSVQLAGASEWQMESEYVLFLTHGHKMSFSKTNESPIIDM